MRNQPKTRVRDFPGASFLQLSLVLIESRKKAVYDSQQLANRGIELRWSLRVRSSGLNEVQTLAWWAYRDRAGPGRVSGIPCDEYGRVVLPEQPTEPTCKRLAVV